MLHISRESPLKNPNSSKAMSARGRNGNKKTAVTWCMFPCSSGFVLVLFRWERGLINLNLSRLFALTQG